MRRQQFLRALLPLAACAAIACSSDDNLALSQQDTITTTEQPSTSLSIVLNLPSSASVSYARGTRAVGDNIAAQDFEKEVKKVDVYVFTATAADAADGNYLFALHEQFNASELTGADEKHCYLDYGGIANFDTKYAKVIVTANDQPRTLTAGTTTLATFKNQQSPYKNYADLASDSIAGGITGTTPWTAYAATKGFPMSAIAKSAPADPTAAATEAVQLTKDGVQMKAELVRTMARLDIFNDTPNLTITSVELSNTIAGSYLLPKSPIAVPTGLAYLTVKPITPLLTGALDATNGTGVAFVGATDDNGDATGDAAAIREANTQPFFYLAEQKVGGRDLSPVCKINYKITCPDPADATQNKDYPGWVQVPFATISYDQAGAEQRTYIANVQRNYIYTIVIGNGKYVDYHAKVVATKFDVRDWVDENDMITIIKPRVEENQ